MIYRQKIFLFRFGLIILCIGLITFYSCNKFTENNKNHDSISEYTAFININLVAMTDENIAENQSVLVEGTRIIKIGSTDEVELPETTNIIDGEGAYLMPGLADMHMHTQENWCSGTWRVCPFKLYLANGVTTVRCMGPFGSHPSYILKWRDEIKQGERIGPTIYTSGPIIYGPVGDPQKIVQEQKNQGYDFIKIYSYLSKKEAQEVINSAKQLNMYIAGHIPFAVGLEGIIAAGIDEIAHIEELDWEFIKIDRERELEPGEWMKYILGLVIEQYKKKFGYDVEEALAKNKATMANIINILKSSNVPLCTTLVIDYIIIQKLFEPDLFLAKPENKYLPEVYIDAFNRGWDKHQQQFKGNEEMAHFKYGMDKKLLQELKKAGIPLLLSTDAGTGLMGIVPGFSLHDELQILIENGFTPYEAIFAGTVQASKVIEAITGDNNFGTIEVGKKADLILVRYNPLQDIKNIKELLGVMAAGKWFSKEKLEEMIMIYD